MGYGGGGGGRGGGGGPGGGGGWPTHEPLPAARAASPEPHQPIGGSRERPSRSILGLPSEDAVATLGRYRRADRSTAAGRGASSSTVWTRSRRLAGASRDAG